METDSPSSLTDGPFTIDNALPTPQETSLAVPETVEAPIVDLANLVFDITMLVAGILAVFFVIIGGLRYITAGGNQDKVKQARATVINSVIGVIVVLSAFAVVRLAVGLARTLTEG